MQTKRVMRQSVATMFIFLIMLSSLSTVWAAGSVEERASLTFSPNDYALMDKSVEKIPTTAEVMVKLSPNINTRQVIIGNYKDGSQNSWSLELTADNRLRYWEQYKDASGVQRSISDLYVTGVDVATDEWMQLSVVRNIANKKIEVYKNGAKAFERAVTYIAPDNTASTLPMYVGTDYRKSMWLNGEISEIRLWNTARTPEEISQYTSTKLTGAEQGLAHAWRLHSDNISPSTIFSDLVNTNPIKITAEGFEAKIVGGEVDYSHTFSASGVSFASSDVQLAMKNKLPAVPRTIETMVKLPKDLKVAGGVVVGNYMNAGYYDYDLPYFNFEVTAKGEPRLYWKKKGVIQDTVISGVDLRQDKWVHVAMTFDDLKDEVKLVINGNLIATVPNNTFQPDTPAQPLKIGGDYRFGNNQYFKGEIANVRLWSTVRTVEEIAANMEVEPTNSTALLGSWKLDAVANGVYADISSNGNDVSTFADWIEPNFAKGDYSMVVLPDTQFLTESYANKYYEMMDWIKENKSMYNIQAVMSLGDIVNTPSSATQWQVAQNGFNVLDNLVPYTLLPGNHDMSMNLDRTAVNYNKYFPYSKFSQLSHFGGAYKEGYMDNVYYYVTVGDREYMIFSVAFAPTADILEWADKQIAAHPEKNVIITTHSYMYWNGEQLSNKYTDYPSKYISDAKDADVFWNEVVSKHKNVNLVLSGHIGYPDLVNRTDTGINGNTVNQMLADAQGLDASDGGYAMLMMLTFHNDSNQVDVNWYSSDKDKLYRDRNQFSIEMEHVKTLKSVESLSVIQATYGTAKEDINLPKTISVQLSNGEQIDVPVTWNSETYDATTEGTYLFTGTLAILNDVFNPKNITASIFVTVENEDTGGTTPGENPGTGGGTTPGENPGTGGGTTPGENPGTGGGTTPGENPGTGGGTTPGENPGTGGGTTPGENPGTGGGTMPGENPGTGGGTTPGGNPSTGGGVTTVGSSTIGSVVTSNQAEGEKETSSTEKSTLGNGAKVDKVTDNKTGDVQMTITGKDGTVTLVNIPKSSADVTAKITLPSGVNHAVVSIPVTNPLAGTVAVIVKADGSEEVIKTSVINNGILYVPVDGSVTIKIVNRNQSFADIQNDLWYSEAVAFATSHDLFTGTSDTTFNPDNLMTRGMLVTVLQRLSNGKAEESAQFTDVMSGHYFVDAVAWASENGIVSGTGNGKFAPNDNITREQLAAILYRYAGASATSASDVQLTYSDSDRVSEWAQDAMNWAVKSGLISGKGNGLLDPTGGATRAEVAQIILRYCKYVMNTEA
ncbi:LamG-like jellyroll fold domain-containing protein [Paenibacillus sp. FSL R10-2734]|uniref:LamG-like jellyroll fold domain-containing protein n=1 Tax=Paenibacillus sp. FSL R10-2734 TaxID=2954691 RepID=UPI0030DA5D1A